MQKYNIKNYLWIIVFCLAMPSYGQKTLTLDRGRVIDSLKIPESENYFSVYLPKAFTMETSWPILFGFDSSGLANRVSRLYKAAAEENGYVIVTSNFPKSLDTKQKNDYAISLMNYIFSVFPIQKKRVYVTALNEDAKLISLLPIAYDEDIFGVIALENSYMYDSSLKIKDNFSYIGIVNTSNFRYKEFLKNKKYLRRKGVKAEVFNYEGKLRSPSPQLLQKALSTFTLHAMDKGVIPHDSIWIQNRFQKELQLVESQISEGKYILAHNEVERIYNEYESFFNTNNLKIKLKEIKKSKGYKEEKRKQTKYLYQETFYKQSYFFSIREDIQTLNYENLGWWQYQVEELDPLLSSKEKYESAMASRVLGYLKNLVIDYKNNQVVNDKTLEKRMFLNILSIIIDKKDYESYLKVISLSALDEDYETALFYLEKLLQNGYKDFDQLYAIEGTLAIKMTKDYNQLIKKHLGKSKYFFSE